MNIKMSETQTLCLCWSQISQKDEFLETVISFIVNILFTESRIKEVQERKLSIFINNVDYFLINF